MFARRHSESQKIKPAKRSAEKRQRSLARAYIDLGLFEIDPSLAELLANGASAKTVVRLALEPTKLQSKLGCNIKRH